MRIIAVLDYENISNPLFIKSLGNALQQARGAQIILVHGDSRYTEELIQTGMMRMDAIIRCTRELSKKITTYFADFGVPCLPIHGYQRSTIRMQNNTLKVNIEFIKSLPVNTVWVISNLIESESGNIVPAPLPDVLQLLQLSLLANHIILFKVGNSADSTDKGNKKTLLWKFLTKSEKNFIPNEFHNYNKPVIISNTNIFNNLDDIIYSDVIV